MRLGNALAGLALMLAMLVRHVEYFPEWAQFLISLGWAVSMFYSLGGAR